MDQNEQQDAADQVSSTATDTLFDTEPSSDEDHFDGESNRKCPPDCKHHKAHKEEPKIDLSKLVRVNCFDRPAPNKEDMVVFMKKGRVHVGYVSEVDHRLRQNPMYTEAVCGTTYTLEQIPTGVPVTRCLEETHLIECGFSLGETVTRYVNAFPDDEKRRAERVPSQGTIGQVVACKLMGDVLVLPSKMLVARNVDLSTTEPVEMINFNSANNFIMYGEWVGDVKDLVNEVVLEYKRTYRLTVREGGKQGVFLIRRERQDETKSLVPGEEVTLTVAEAMSKHSRWEKEPPALLRRRAGKVNSKQDSISCIIKEIRPYAIRVNWLTSASSVTPPPETLGKDELAKCVRIDLSANARVASADRVRAKTSEGVTVMTKQEYNAHLQNEYAKVFDKPTKKAGASSSSSTDQQPTAAKSARIEEDEEGERAAAAEEDMKEHEDDMDSDSSNYESCGEEAGGEGEGDKAKSGEAEGAAAVAAAGDESHDTADDEPASGAAAAAAKKARYPGGRLKRHRKPLARRQHRRQPVLAEGATRDARVLLGDEFVGEVICPRSLVTVEWMDGRVEEDIPGYSLVPVDPDLDQQDHIPGTIVARKENEAHDAEFGLILSTNDVDRSTRVRWFHQPEDAPPVMKEDEEMTLFDIMIHPHYRRLMLGNFGVNVRKTSTDMREVMFQVMRDLQSGKQEVRYLNGEKDELWPQEMSHIPIAEDEAPPPGPHPSDEVLEHAMHMAYTSDGHISLPSGGHALISVGGTSSLADDDTKQIIDEAVRGGAFALKLSAASSEWLNEVKAREFRLLVLLQESAARGVTDPQLMHSLPLFPQAVQFVAAVEEMVAVVPPPKDWPPKRCSAFWDAVSGGPEERTEIIMYLNDEEKEFPMEMAARQEAASCITKLEMLAETAEPEWMKRVKDLCINDETIEHMLGLIREKVGAVWSQMDKKKEDGEGEKTETSTSTEKPAAVDVNMEEEAEEDMEVEQEKEQPVEEEKEEEKRTSPVEEAKGTFAMVEACAEHKWLADVSPTGRPWLRAVQREHKLLTEHVPEGIHVRGFEDRLDLLSLVVEGPRGTPFEATPFYFDVRLPALYPSVPPEVHFVAYSAEQLNPNLYQAGKVCTSLLGTWSGQGIETWGPSSNLLQVFLSIQGLILVPEPYFNEAGYESRKHLPETVNNSCRYNEVAAVNSLEYMRKIYANPPAAFAADLRGLVDEKWPEFRERLLVWSRDEATPDYPTHMSKGYRMALEKSATRMDDVIQKHKS